MLKQMDGSHAVAEAIALCRPEVVSCYPITPQTHIVEHLSTLIRAGRLTPCEYITVESEFAAMSACIGASAMGSRTYTATASQGLLYMMEAVYNASGLGLPIVMTLGNRAIGAPINIWNDHSDAYSALGSGWIQLFVESNQQAMDVHIQAFRLAEQLGLPVMVNMDGFILTHAYERVDMPEQEQVDAFLPAFRPQHRLDPDNPMSMGAMVGPEAFTEVRYIAHHKQLAALEVIEAQAGEFAEIFGRDSGGLVRGHQAEGAETLIVTMGSVIGTINEVVDAMREDGHSIGAVTIRSLRPFPKVRLAEQLAHAKRVVVLEKDLAVGIGGLLALQVQLSLGLAAKPIYSIIAGLGGRAITRAALRPLFEQAIEDRLDQTSFLGLDREIVERQLAREQREGMAGPAAENMLLDIGALRAARTG